jgi:hypothetical protein
VDNRVDQLDAAAAGADELLDELDFSDELDVSDELDFSEELDDDEEDSDVLEVLAPALLLPDSRLSVR